jgi:peroxiredoxin
MRDRRPVIPLLLVLTLAASHRAGAQQPGAGTPAPDFSLLALDSSTVRLTSLRGHPVVIAFWATWCKPCKEEMPALAALYQAHRGDGLVFLAVNSGLEKETRVRRFTEQLALPYPILIDRKQKTLTAYAAFGLPLTVFVDTAGFIRYRVQGPIDSGQIDAGLRTILPQH